MRAHISRTPPSRQPTPLARQVRTAALVLLAILLLAYPLDWAIWRLRLAAGSGMSAVDVTDMTAATLKGNRFEIYSEQTTTVTCSRSLLPEADAGPCWWLRRHPQRVTQY